LIEFESGEIELVEVCFPLPRGIWSATVVTDVPTDPARTDYSKEEIPFSKLRLIEWVPDPEKQIHQKLVQQFNEWKKQREKRGLRFVGRFERTVYYHVTTLDGKVYETFNGAIGLEYHSNPHSSFLIVMKPRDGENSDVLINYKTPAGRSRR